MSSPAQDRGLLLGQGLCFDEMPIGFRFYTKGRTITETDLVNFINNTWFTEDLFVNTSGSSQHTLKGRVVPAMMLYCFAEGLISPSVEFTGQAFLGTNIDVKAPTVVGDTIHVECEVIESRLASKGHRGLVRTRNDIVNQRGDVVVVYTPLRLVAAKPADK